jgi:hypothetical protein
MFAMLTLNLQKAMDSYRIEVDAISETKNVGTLRWYAAQAKKFQLGDNLIIDENGIRYPSIDLNKRIVVQAAASENVSYIPRRVIVKVAKKGTEGKLIPINELELSAFNSYMSCIRFVGIDYQVITLPPDKIKLSIQVRLNPLLRTELGFDRIDTTIKLFLQSLRFDSRFYISELVAHLMADSEVIDAKIGFFQPGVFPVVFTSQTHYDSEAGHLELHEDSQILYTYENTP